MLNFNELNLIMIDESVIGNIELDRLIVTHSGLFHADEVLAIAAYLMGNSPYPNGWAICRTRNPEIVDAAACRIDVGGRVDHSTYDHHQRDGAGTRDNGTPYASAGLVWKKHGYHALMSVFTDEFRGLTGWDTMSDYEKVIGDHGDRILNNIDRNLIQGIDAVDCGRLDLVTGAIPASTISHVISSFNPISWDATNQERDRAFLKALIFAFDYLQRTIAAEVERARATVAVMKAGSASVDGIMILDQGMPWVTSVLDNMNHFNDVQLCVFPSAAGSDWKIQTLPETMADPQSQKCSAPATICGLRGTDLDKVTGLTGGVFVHPGGFIGGATTKEEALALAAWWINNQ